MTFDVAYRRLTCCRQLQHGCPDFRQDVPLGCHGNVGIDLVVLNDLINFVHDGFVIAHQWMDSECSIVLRFGCAAAVCPDPVDAIL